MTQSEALFNEAVKYIPGGVNSPVRAFGSIGSTPRFITKADKAYMWDEDGNCYIDYIGSWGPMILGHNHPAVLEAVLDACRLGLSFGAATRPEVTMAKLICDIVPSIDMVRMVNSGTEAVMSAIRTARGYTGRDKIVKFTGCYHGHSDALLVKAGSAALTTAVPDSAGVPASYTQNTLVAEYNNKESVRELMEQYGSNVAAIIVEPVAANMGVVPPKEGFLEFLREITLKYETVLIFDEVITGFRLGFGGAQEYFGVKPDMTTLGKIVGGGMPIAAYGGRKEIMDRVSPTGPVYQAGTLSGNPIATTAGIETLKILKAHPEYYKKIDESAKKIADAYRKMAEEKSIPLHVNQIGSLLSAFQTGETVDDYDSALTSDTKAYTEYFWKMLDNGIYVAPAQFEAMFVSVAHTEEDIKRTCEVIGL